MAYDQGATAKDIFELKRACAGPDNLAARALIGLAAGGLRLSEIGALNSSDIVSQSDEASAPSVVVTTNGKSKQRSISIGGEDAIAILAYDRGLRSNGAVLGSAAKIWAGLNAGFPFHAFRHALARRLMEAK
ncbi:hypothetical protein [Beijerinckia sp. L45]|uniref:hypothetical protein n=1 Tax=Beijerinckia sp. L45 TaxID=1641855 RepID=UPI00131B7F6F|nr:hypothetical protein [Beijerinckia sp. L45]